jgi:F-type H+-transporting ATPase subunit a
VAKLDDHLPYALRQFETEIVVPLSAFGYDISLTTSSTAKLTTSLLLVAYLAIAMRERRLVPGRLQASAEMIHSLVADTVTRFLGPDGPRVLPFVFTMFVFILFGTLLGLTPIKETFTSHLVVTLALSLTVFAYANYLAIQRHGFGYFRHFLPPGVPVFVAPVLVAVEVLSYLFRPITLGFRIFANIFAGHVMLKLFADFCTMLVVALGAAGVAAALLPALFMVIIYAFEVMIVCIQAYIFMLITTLYLRDALRPH